jgi:gliding motility-associated-like protein
MGSFLLRTWLFIALLMCACPLLATHNRAGEITYTHRPDIAPYAYDIWIRTCTKTSSYQADRPWLKIRYGDESSDLPDSQLDSLPRIQTPTPVAGQDAQINVYYGLHVYPGPGIYVLEMNDPNRNADIVNIQVSVSIEFCIQSVLVISPATGHNNSVRLLNPPKERACMNQKWVHNPGAYDPDGDSLVFSFVNCRGNNCVLLPADYFQMPDVSTPDPNDTFTINSATGDVVWNVPPMPGEFNFAILISEYRNGFFVGSVVRDMQIDVIVCPNIAPIVELPSNSFCVDVNDSLSFTVNVVDPDNSLPLSISAYGGPLTEVVNTATFSNLTFTWVPECTEVRNQPYTVSFEATDSGNIPLTDIATATIKVVPPAVLNPQAVADANAISLSWNASPCAPVFTALEASQVRYKIYRRNNLFGFEPEQCEVGVPEYTGYQLIGENTGLNNTTYNDQNLNFGSVYCYMVVTCWPDGALSYASEEFCDTIMKDLPVITKASVGVTDIDAGVDTVWWSPPTMLDTTIFLPPYQYKLYHYTSVNAQRELVETGAPFEFLTAGDTTFIHQNINTSELSHYYEVDFYSQGDSVGTSTAASTVYLVATPNDNSVTISMNFNVPWNNESYKIYRKAPGEIDFSLIGTSNLPTYLDSGLLNNQEYCYKVLSVGSYNSTGVPDPLVNWSQETCAKPYDRTPPCPPVFTAVPSCSDENIIFDWFRSTANCSNDVTQYKIYWSPSIGQPYQVVATLDVADTLSWTFNDLQQYGSIAGCFAITALDSLNLWPDGKLHQNESSFGTEFCNDNCPVYLLPNIFSPNGDGRNDFFIPIAVRFVKDVDFQVFNRWGTRVFQTNDKLLNWNGTDQVSGELLSDGTYYYVVTVHTLRLEGIVTEQFSGYIQIIDATRATTKP